MQDDTVIASIGASEARRVVAVVLLGLSGVAIIYGALSGSPSLIWKVALLGVGTGAFWIAGRMWQATGQAIELTATELRCSDGFVIARVEDMRALERGILSSKPSNGFLVQLRVSARPAWRPGMWWRYGRRVGVGGVTPGAQARVMADRLALMLAERDQASDQAT